MMRSLCSTIGMALIAVACSGSTAGGPPGASDIGKACRASSECESGACAPLVGVAPDAELRAVCTQQCAADDDCLGGWACSPVPGGPSVCVCAPASETCDGKDNDCNGVVDDHDARCGVPPPQPPCVDAACCTAQEVFCHNACVDVTNDSANCGACGAACADGAACVDRVCRCGADRTAACGPGAPTRSCESDDRCHEITTVVAPAYKTGVVQFALTSGSVFYLSSTFSVGGPIERLNVFAKPAAKGATLVSADGGRIDLASDGTHIAYAAPADEHDVFSPKGIWSCPAGDCTNKIHLADEDPKGLLLALGGDAYWLLPSANALRKCSLAGCAESPTSIALGAGSPIGVVAGDASGLYFSTSGGSIDTASLVDGTRSVLATGQPNVRTIALDAASVYWSTDAAIYGCKKTACLPSLIVTRSPVSGLRVDAGQLYWAGNEGLLTCSATACTPRTLVRPPHGGGQIGAFALDTNATYFELVRASGDGTSVERIDR